MKIDEQRGFCRFFIPHYDEIVLFTMSFTCLLLFTTGVFANYENVELVPPREYDPRLIAAAFIFIAGLILSLYHAVIKRQKTQMEKSFMLFFAVVLNAFSGFMAGAYDLMNMSGWLIVFPLWNMLNSAALLFMEREGVIDESNIDDQFAPRGQVALAAAIVLALYCLCHVVYKLAWVQTLSICLVYATNLIKLIEAWFSRILPVRDPV